MNVQTIGSNRPKLSLAFAGPAAALKTGVSSRAPTRRRSPTLTGRELRRIVAELIG